ncbi:MAG TPA: hypothetical protein VD833_07185 [Vicinamibacterales bacterium]|nr:hypothetical protein [Vicinamibacterales bacterium]
MSGANPEQVHDLESCREHLAWLEELRRNPRDRDRRHARASGEVSAASLVPLPTASLHNAGAFLRRSPT